MTPRITRYPKNRKTKNLPSLAGKVFNRLTVVEGRGLNRSYRRLWLCRCVCGNEIVTATSDLHSGNTQSCGCLLREIVSTPRGKELWRSLGVGVAAKNALISTYRHGAKRRGLPWDLTNEQAEKLFQGDCHYCGIPPSYVYKSKKLNGSYTYNGIDRIDNARGYESGNVLACCGVCNRNKGEMSYTEFCGWVKRACTHLGLMP